jgi:hypothetical protein
MYSHNNEGKRIPAFLHQLIAHRSLPITRSIGICVSLRKIPIYCHSERRDGVVVLHVNDAYRRSCEERFEQGVRQTAIISARNTQQFPSPPHTVLSEIGFPFIAAGI